MSLEKDSCDMLLVASVDYSHNMDKNVDVVIASVLCAVDETSMFHWLPS